jgi:hypothetical protein
VGGGVDLAGSDEPVVFSFGAIKVLLLAAESKGLLKAEGG